MCELLQNLGSVSLMVKILGFANLSSPLRARWSRTWNTPFTMNELNVLLQGDPALQLGLAALLPLEQRFSDLAISHAGSES